MIYLDCCSKKEKDQTWAESASHVMRHYKINESKKNCQWIHMLKLETRDRTFELHLPSFKEASIWLRVLQLIIKMNKQGINTSQMNPYVFEEREKIKNDDFFHISNPAPDPKIMV
jgi:hypothetical protein